MQRLEFGLFSKDSGQGSCRNFVAVECRVASYVHLESLALSIRNVQVLTCTNRLKMYQGFDLVISSSHLFNK